MKKNIKRVMGILLAATMSISLVMPAFASQTSNTDEATEVQEQNEQTDANGSADTANDTQTTGGSSDQGTDEQKEYSRQHRKFNEFRYVRCECFRYGKF